MTEYDASQKQRAYERRIRATKRDLSGLDSAIKETDDVSLKKDLQIEFDRKSVLLKKQDAKIKDFTQQTGLYRDRAREKSYGFNKSVSQKAVWEYKKYIKAHFESGQYLETTKRIGTNDVDLHYIHSNEFRSKFNKITNNSKINDTLRNYAEAMLTHRKGTDGEDLYIIHSETGELLLRDTKGKNELGVEIDFNTLKNLRDKYYGKMIGIHNHPTNLLPTGSDYGASTYRGYQFGIVVTHNGKVYKYKSSEQLFLPQLFDMRIDKYSNLPYNMSVEDAHIKVLNEFAKEYGIEWQEL